VCACSVVDMPGLKYHFQWHIQEIRESSEICARRQRECGCQGEDGVLPHQSA
jgi:hypothetical protein